MMKHYCCDKMREAMKTIRNIHSMYYSIFKVHDGRIKFDTHINGEYGYIRHREVILKYCPFCGKKIQV